MLSYSLTLTLMEIRLIERRIKFWEYHVVMDVKSPNAM